MNHYDKFTEWRLEWYKLRLLLAKRTEERSWLRGMIYRMKREFDNQ